MRRLEVHVPGRAVGTFDKELSKIMGEIVVLEAQTKNPRKGEVGNKHIYFLKYLTKDEKEGILKIVEAQQYASQFEVYELNMTKVPLEK